MGEGELWKPSASGLWQPPKMETTMETTMRSGGRTETTMAGNYDDVYHDGVRIGPPPDLASLLLHSRIVYLGMPIVPAVTELIIAELLYLNYDQPSKDVTLYINSPGTINSERRSVGFETEAFAIADTIKYITPRVKTICVGQAFGAAAMLLAQGEPGYRFCLPNASIMLHQPRSMARGQASDIAIKAREVMVNRKVQCEMIARACGKSVEDVMHDAQRTKYLQPQEAVEYGLIDAILDDEEDFDQVRPNFGRSLDASPREW